MWKSFTDKILKESISGLHFCLTQVARLGLNNITLKNRYPPPPFPNAYLSFSFFIAWKTNSLRHQEQAQAGWFGCRPEQHNGFLLPFCSSLSPSLQSTHKALHDFLVSGSSFVIFPLCVGKKLKCKIICPETIILFWGHRKKSRCMDEYEAAMIHNTHPLLLLESQGFFFNNPYLILQKSSLTAEKIV